MWIQALKLKGIPLERERRMERGNRTRDVNLKGYGIARVQWDREMGEEKQQNQILFENSVMMPNASVVKLKLII